MIFLEPQESIALCENCYKPNTPGYSFRIIGDLGASLCFQCLSILGDEIDRVKSDGPIKKKDEGATIIIKKEAE